MQQRIAFGDLTPATQRQIDHDTYAWSVRKFVRVDLATHIYGLSLTDCRALMAKHGYDVPEKATWGQLFNLIEQKQGKR